MKLANPLHYPLAVLCGGLFLVGGVRVAKLPSWVALPGAVVIATGGGMALKAREPETLDLGNPALEREVQSIRQKVQILTRQADVLKVEATRLLTEANQMELLGTVQYACDRAHELPAKIDHLARRLKGGDSLLSVADLQKQLTEANAKLTSSSGPAQEQWGKLIVSLNRNIELAKQGEDARQAQIVSLSTLISDAAGVLQQLQNKLRKADLSNASEATALQALSQEFSGFQENLELLIS
ncbi:MAG: hypothetical protein QNJ46_28115 [Leptolyngbyaceae cyanobacterium MO_188.B28]|nr:hypothetical protein [Leptolyngbyaceae cyanobacterium MO_188.B28]